MTGSDDETRRELEGQLTLFAGQVVGTQDAAIESESIVITVQADTTDDTKNARPKGEKRSKKIEPKGVHEMQTQEAPSEIDFEASLTQLESVVRELDGENKLEAALKLFETGIKLSVDCEKFIKSAEQKIEILKKQADGSLEAQSFESETKRILAGE